MPNEQLTEKRTLTQKKLEANRRNALKSTGPASARGRAISSQNARKFVLLPFENPALPMQLTVQYFGRYIPTNAKERQLVNTMIQSDRMRFYFEALEARTEKAAGPRGKRASVVPYAFLVAECAYRNARQKLEAMRAKAA